MLSNSIDNFIIMKKNRLKFNAHSYLLTSKEYYIMLSTEQSDNLSYPEIYFEEIYDDK